MESATVICNCKHVTYGQIDQVVRGAASITSVVDVFDDVQRVTSCATGCGGCYSKILDIIADMLYQR